MDHELQDTGAEPKTCIKSADELSEEDLDSVSGGMIIHVQPTLPAPVAPPIVPQISNTYQEQKVK